MASNTPSDAPPSNADRLAALWGEIHDLSAAEELLEWDQETSMPPRGVAGRSKLLGTVAALKHEKTTAPELGEVLAACAAEAEPGGELAAQVARARHHVDRAVRVPTALARELAEARSTALAAWQGARQRSDFELFRPHLARLVELRRREATAIAPGGDPYDALLDAYEPGATGAELEPLFDDLEQRLVPLVRAVVESGVEVDETPAHGDFPVPRQLALGREVVTAFGFDFDAGRLDPASHPFCVGINPGDVRLTWRWEEDDFRPALFGIVHEAGHGLYEQGLPAPWARTPLGEAVSLGIHESQSRLWENEVARSRPFWRWALPLAQRHLPGTEGLTAEALWPALHTVKPSLIRVEADEATYNLHVAVRFRLERALFAGELAVDELPGEWNRLYGELVGVTPPDDAQGVLQDIHWSMGAFGYFPTYTLGTLAAAQLFAAARQQLDDLDGALAAGEFAPLLAWLRDNVHRHGSRYSTAELLQRATGRPLTADAFLATLGRQVEEVYGVTAG